MQETNARRRPVAHPTADAVCRLVKARLEPLNTEQINALSIKLNLHVNTLYGLRRGTARPTLDSACGILQHTGDPINVPNT